MARRFAHAAQAELVAGHWDWASYLAKLSIAVDPSQPWAYMTLGHAYVRRGSLEKAREAYGEAADIDPLGSLAQTRLGDIELELGHFAEAEAAYRRALAVQPGNPDLLANLAVAVREQGRLEEAAALLEDALNLEPEYGRLLAELGETRVRQGNLQEGIGVLSRAVSVLPASPRARYYLAVGLAGMAAVSERTSEWRRALEQARLAHEMDPSNAEYSRLLARLTESVRARAEDWPDG